jgi:rhodanese-related sulfurtransferase
MKKPEDLLFTKIISPMKAKTYYPAIIFAVALLISSCNAIYEEGEELAMAHQSLVTEITADELKSKVENGENFLLLDVRQSSEYEQASIPGALNIPRGLLEFRIRDDNFWEEEFMYTPENDEEIIVYCKLGYRGILSAMALRQLGFTNVRNLAGGIVSWDPDIEQVTPKNKGGGGCGG